MLYPKENVFDPTPAFAFGTLIDFMITEPDRVNVFTRKITGQYADYPFTHDDFDKAREMKRSFFKDPFCEMIAKAAECQTVSTMKNKPFEFGGANFTLDVRCKWDLLVRSWKMGGDIKSTTAETQSQFEDACEHFDYFRSRAWYMDIEGNDKDMLIGISKKNFKVFKIPINRGDKYYNKGKERYDFLAYHYWQFFDGFKLTT